MRGTPYFKGNPGTPEEIISQRKKIQSKQYDIKQLKQDLVENKIEVVDLSKQNINDEAVNLLIEGFEKNTSVRSLKLNINGIKRTDLIRFIISLQNNKTLEKFIIDNLPDLPDFKFKYIYLEIEKLLLNNLTLIDVSPLPNKFQTGEIPGRVAMITTEKNEHYHAILSAIKRNQAFKKLLSSFEKMEKELDSQLNELKKFIFLLNEIINNEEKYQKKLKEHEQAYQKILEEIKSLTTQTITLYKDNKQHERSSDILKLATLYKKVKTKVLLDLANFYSNECFQEDKLLDMAKEFPKNTDEYKKLQLLLGKMYLTHESEEEGIGIDPKQKSDDQKIARFRRIAYAISFLQEAADLPEAEKFLVQCYSDMMGKGAQKDITLPMLAAQYPKEFKDAVAKIYRVRLEIDYGKTALDKKHFIKWGMWNKFKYPNSEETFIIKKLPKTESLQAQDDNVKISKFEAKA